MKNLLIVFLIFSLCCGMSSCKEAIEPIIDKQPISNENPTFAKEIEKKNARSLISKYSVVKTFENEVSSEFEILFSYDSIGNLLSAKRIDKRYNAITKLLAQESFTNHFLIYDSNGIPNQMKIYNSEGLKFNSYAIHTLVFADSLLKSVDFTLMKDDKIIVKIPNNFKLIYNNKKQLTSYFSGNDKGHDFVYKDAIHTSSLLKNVSNYDFEYSKALNPTADYNYIVKYIVNQVMESENAKGFGILSRFQPSKIINKSGGFHEFTSTVNAKGFPVEIIERDYQKNESASRLVITTKIEYAIFNE